MLSCKQARTPRKASPVALEALSKTSVRVTIKLRRFEGSKTNGRIRAMSMQLQNCTIKNVQPLTFNKEIDSLSFGSALYTSSSSAHRLLLIQFREEEQRDLF